MLKKWGAGLGMVVFAASISGCSTGKNYETDVNSLNGRVSALQGQLAAKDEELSRIQSQLNEERSARMAASEQLEKTKNELAEKAQQASNLAAVKRVEPAALKAEESDLK